MYLCRSFKLIAFSLMLIGLYAGCTPNSAQSNIPTQNSSVNPHPLKQEIKTAVTASRDIQQNTTKLTEILQQVGLLNQMVEWQGKALLVKVDETKTPPEFHYYYYKSSYVDTNQNNVQDSGDEGFFNPASTVKVGIAALVLEKLHQQNLGRETEYRVVGNSTWYRIDNDIRRSLVLSDNESTNRLILFLGFEQLNRRMQVKGVQYYVIDRLMLDKGTLISSPAFELRSDHQVIQQSKQPVTSKFSCWEVRQKLGNCATANALVEILTRIVQPQYFSVSQGFNLKDTDRSWLQQVMSHTPKQEGFNYPDNYCRVLTTVEHQIASKSGRMLSKCGVAVFTHTFVDTSYIETDTGEKYYIAFAVTPPQSISETEVKKWMNMAVSLILPKLT